MHRLTPRALASLCILLLGAALGLMTEPRRLGDASTYVMMADSAWADGDFVYAPEDLARVRQMRFANVPDGLFLIQHAWGYTYGKPLLYPLVALPFYGLFGVRGFFALNGMLLAALLLLGADILSHRLPWPRAVGIAAIVIGFSVTPAYLYWIDPFLLCSAMAAGLVAAWRHNSPTVAGALAAALASCRLPYAVVALAPAVLWGAGGQWPALRRYVTAGTVSALLLLGVGRDAAGQWSPYGGERLYYDNVFPYQAEAGGADPGGSAEIALDRSGWLNPREIARSNLYFFLGRFAGVLVYFPTLLACAVWSRRWDREKWLWLAALLATAQALQLALPHNIFGGAATVGNRLFVLLPLALVFVDFVAWRRWRVLASLALMLLAVPMARAPLQRSLDLGGRIAELPYRLLPFEWTQAMRVYYPASFPGPMHALTANQYDWQNDGVWTQAGTTAEYVLARALDAPPTVYLSTSLSGVQVSDGGVPLDPPLQPGVERAVTLAHPLVSFAEERNRGREVGVYHLRITADGGTAPVTAHGDRALGVYVRPVVGERLR